MAHKNYLIILQRNQGGKDMNKKILVLGLFLLLASFPLNAYATDLTGVWDGDDGGIYYLRQIGNEIFWYGENDPLNPSWSNVAHGRIYGSILILNWADVTKGILRNDGLLIVRAVSDFQMVLVYKDKPFGGSLWTR